MLTEPRAFSNHYSVKVEGTLNFVAKLNKMHVQGVSSRCDTFVFKIACAVFVGFKRVRAQNLPKCIPFLTVYYSSHAAQQHAHRGSKYMSEKDGVVSGYACYEFHLTHYENFSHKLCQLTIAQFI